MKEDKRLMKPVKFGEIAPKERKLGFAIHRSGEIPDVDESQSLAKGKKAVLPPHGKGPNTESRKED